VRVLPYGAVRKWLGEIEKWEADTRGRFSPSTAMWAVVKRGLRLLGTVANLYFGEKEAMYGAEQMLFSFAGCSVVLEPGDVLWLSADVITQRAGVSSSSLSLRLTTSLPPEMCNESPAARRDDREFFPITERFQTKKKPKQSKPAYFASGNMPDLQRKINQEMAAAYDELMLS